MIDDLDNIYPLGGLFNTEPTNPEFPNYLKCGVRYTLNETKSSYMIVRHNGEFRKIDINDVTFTYMLRNLPVGSIMDWVGTENPPKGWALLDGSNFNPTAYPELAGVLSGSTLPNFAGRVTIYKDGGLINNVGDQIGATLKFMNQTHLPPHSHQYIDEVRGSDGENDGEGGQPSTSPNVHIVDSVTKPQGGRERMENVQPTVVYSKIIKAVPETSEFTDFIPLDNSQIVSETGLEFKPFCQRQGVSAIVIDDPDPTYDLSLCPLSLDIGLSTMVGGLSSFTITRVGNRYTGFIGVTDTGIPTPIYLDIMEDDNSHWDLIYNVGNFNTTLMTSSIDFPSCPDQSTWDSPFLFGGETITIDYLSASP